jgi:uncharacterized protein (DUF1015 family)
VPSLRAFRGLRFDASVAGDLGRLVCPPYDVIPAAMREELAGRDPHNAVRLELPAEEPGDDGLARYRRAAQLLAEWRTSGVLRKDREPGVYVYEQSHVTEGGAERTQRGFFARLKLEPFGPESGVRPHEATMSGPKEDRLRLLRATGTNTSAVMALYRSGGRSAALLDDLTGGAPDADVRDDERVRHRLWYVPLEASDNRSAGSGELRVGMDRAAELLGLAAEGPLVIADGHHRYETALRYRDERNRACEEDPPFDYVLAALFDLDAEPLSILPTHRLVREGPAGEELLNAASGLFEVERLGSSDELVRRMAERNGAGGRFGLYTGGSSALMRPIRGQFTGTGGDAKPGTLGTLDVTLLAIALQKLAGLPSGAGAGERLGYTKDSRDAIRAVDAGEYASAFLLDPTNVQDLVAVVEEGDLMPQKSTYFYPKVLTGLVFNPLEG